MKTELPLVSVCIPAYNSEKYISETLNGIFNQTYSNLEVIVVDDGSTDNTVSILQLVSDSRFKYVTQQNKGAAAARNKAYGLSTGAFIKFMDADDLLGREAIEMQVLRLKDNPGCIASAKWGRFFDDDPGTLTYSPEPVWKDMPGIDWTVHSLIEHGRNMMQPGIFLIPVETLNKVGLWNESLSLVDDFEFMTRVIVNSRHVLFCENAVLMYRSGLPGSLSRTVSRKGMESVLLSLELAASAILKVRNDAQSRLACANAFQNWSYFFYPEHMDLHKKAEQRIRDLGGSTLKTEGGYIFKILVAIMGWKNAKLLRNYIKKAAGIIS